MSFHDSLCRRVFLALDVLFPVAPSLLSCPLLLPFVPLRCGEFMLSCAGDAPFTPRNASREYWFRPRRPRDFCGGRPPRRGAGVGFKDSTGVSDGADTDATAGAAGSSVGVGVASEASGSALLSVERTHFKVSLAYRLLFYVQHVLCVCWLHPCVLVHGLSRAAPSRVGSSRLPRAVFALVLRLLCCRPLIL